MKVVTTVAFILMVSCGAPTSAKTVDENFLGSYEGTSNGYYDGTIQFDIERSRTDNGYDVSGSAIIIDNDARYLLTGTLVGDGELTLQNGKLIYKAQIINGITRSGTWTFTDGGYDHETHETVDVRGEFRANKRN